jgi:hypothetical protein
MANGSTLETYFVNLLFSLAEVNRSDALSQLQSIRLINATPEPPANQLDSHISAYVLRPNGDHRTELIQLAEKKEPP